MTKKTLTREEIIHIAHLARLKLTDKEIEKFQFQLSSILDYVGKLNKVNTSHIEPIAQITGLKDIEREDKISDEQSLSQDEALKNAPDKKDGLIKVEAIFKE